METPVGHEWKTLQLGSGLGLLAILMAMGTSLPAHSQAATINADHYGGMLHPSAARPSFEVAAIRRSSPGADTRFSGIVMHPERLQVFATSVMDLIEFAYAVPNGHDLIGGPSWIQSELFDITAKPSEAEVLAVRKISHTN
jgi:hypothetical protein